MPPAPLRSACVAPRIRRVRAARPVSAAPYDRLCREASNWSSLFLPKGAPAGIINALHAATVSALETPSVQERFKELGAMVVAPDRRSPEYLQRFVASEVEKWAAPIKASGASLN